jgi:uncharacterized protein with HEPN domain
VPVPPGGRHHAPVPPLVHPRQGSSRGADLVSEQDVYLNFMVIGEAAKRLSDETRRIDDSVPWKAMPGMRDLLVHRYDGIRAELVWNAVEQQLPVIESKLLALVDRLGGAHWPEPISD